MTELKELKEISLSYITDSIKKGKRPKDISKELNVSEQRLNYYISKLKSKGIIKKVGYGSWEVDLVQELKTSSQATQPQVDHSRGHAFIWKVKIKERYDWKKLLLEKEINFDEVGPYGTPRIILNNNKIWLGKEHIIIYENNSYFGKTALESKKLAVYSLLQELKALSEYLNIPPFRNILFTCSREHYALIKNVLAVQCNRDNEKINVFNEKGLWLSIDNSFNLGELETLGALENKPLDTSIQVQKWWNNQKETSFKVTPDFVLTSFNQLNSMLAQSQVQLLEYKKQNISHLKLIQEYRRENIAWRKHQVKEISKIFSVSTQTKLGDFK